MVGGLDEGDRLVLVMDDATMKSIFVISIILGCLEIVIIIYLFLFIREYQEVRNEALEGLQQYDQINYLIGLISQQEEILKTNMDSKGNDKDAGERWERYLELHKEFSKELDVLQEMMADVSGLSRKDFRF